MNKGDDDTEKVQRSVHKWLFFFLSFFQSSHPVHKPKMTSQSENLGEVTSRWVSIPEDGQRATADVTVEVRRQVTDSYLPRKQRPTWRLKDVFCFNSLICILVHKNLARGATLFIVQQMSV